MPDGHDPLAAHAPTPALSCTWREWIQQSPEKLNFDAVVVGSGYGGSVAALRLAKKGLRVLLLERGSEYRPGDFPNDFSGVPKHFRFNLPGQGTPLGRASGLVEITAGQGMVAVTGNGLGGGSLINAGVVIEPDADVFSQEAWPAPIRHAFGRCKTPGVPSLESAFATARDMLKGQRFNSPLQPQHLLKTRALQRAASTLGTTAHPTDVTIDPSRCIACGDCASGCNVDGAKLTLAMTYLRQAVDTGLVQIVTQAQVYRFERDTADPCKVPCIGQGRWKLGVFSTDAQHQFTSVREAGSERPSTTVPETQQDAANTLRHVRADLLVISAGTLGSTQLLQRSQALAGEALAFSPALGTRLSGNGDSISFHLDAREDVNGIGHGANRTLRDLDPHAPENLPHVVGPTITAFVDLRDRNKPLDQRLLLQDGAVPGTVARAVEELLVTAQTLGQLGQWSFRPGPLRAHSRRPTDPLAATDTLARKTQVLLAMGHDGSPGRMIWLPGMDISAPVYGDPGSLRTYQEQQRLFDRLEPIGQHVHNPLWQWLPEKVQDLMSGARPPATVTTVHPLGGCPMGDHPLHSVVNHLGQVWVHDPANPARGLPKSLDPLHPNAPRVYEGLYVLDGSIVPTSLGCNPLLTITALAERAMAEAPIPVRTSPAITVQKTPARPPVQFAFAPFPKDVLLRETLRSEGHALRGPWADCGPDEDRRLALRVEFASADFHGALADLRHRMDIAQARLTLADTSPAEQGAPPATRRIAVYTRGGKNAWFEFLPAHALSSGNWPVVLGVLQVLVWLGLPIGLLALACVGLTPWLNTLPAALAILFLLSILLPLPSTVCTWLVLRGGWDFRLRDKDTPQRDNLLKRIIRMAGPLARQMVHACECRVMRYHLPMRRTGELSDPDDARRFPRHILLKARKVVMYRASPEQWLCWCWTRSLRRLRLRPSSNLPPLRLSIWEQVMDAEVKIWPRRLAGRMAQPLPLARGTLKMGLDNLFTRGLAQLGARGDTTNGLLLLAGYPLLLLRFLIKTRLLDFRLPDYSHRPVLDPASNEPSDALPLRQADGPPVTPEVHELRDVPRGHSSSDVGTEPRERLRLRLWRYPRMQANGQAGPPDVRHAHWMKLPVRRARSVLLLHAFGQSGLSYTYRQPKSRAGGNLAEAFYAAGYEVWILDSRMSTRSGHAGEPSTVDMQARHDVPAAVDHIIGKLQAELTSSGDDPIQIATFAQCIGAASLWMALLDNRLSYGVTHPGDAPGEVATLSKIACAMFSQVHALVQAPALVRSKSWLPGFLMAMAPSGVIPFAVRGVQNQLGLNLLDRLLNSLPVPEAERQRSRNEDGHATCRRIRFVEAPLFNHDRLHPQTTNDMNRLFGEANVRLFSHARRFVERGRLVDEDGVNRYVTDPQIRRHLAFPVQLLHGQDNALFDVRSAWETHVLLGRLLAPWQRAYSPKPLIVPGYGHLDVLIGKDAHLDVFGNVMAFFKTAYDGVDDIRYPKVGLEWRLRPPRVGPWVGKCERIGDRCVCRVAFIVDDLHGGSNKDDETRVIVRQRTPQGTYVSLAPDRFEHGFFRVNALREDMQTLNPPVRLAYRAVWLDLSLAPSSPEDLVFEVMTAHQIWRPTEGGSSQQDVVQGEPDDARIDGWKANDAQACEAAALQSSVHGDPPRESVEGLLRFSIPAVSLEDHAQGVRFSATCCRYPGLSVDQERIDQALVPLPGQAFSLMVGDQIYADATAGLLDPLNPVERYTERYETAFGSPGMRAFLARMPTCMTPDDHEWIDDFPNGGPLMQWSWGDWAEGATYQQQAQRRRNWAGDALTAFERTLSWPTTYFTKADRECRPRWTLHRQGCVSVYLIDSRSWRKRVDTQVVPPDVLNEIEQALLAAPKDVLNIIVTGSVVAPGLFPAADPAGPGEIDTWQYAPEQRKALVQMLVDHSPGRFLLLSGDYHVSAATELVHEGRTTGAAIVLPPLYAPLPYVNAAPEHINTSEPLKLAHAVLTQHVPPRGDCLRGSGLADIQVKRHGGGFQVVYTRRLTVYETGETTEHICTINLG